MNTSSNGAKKQPKAMRLTQQQSQALAHLAAMTDEGQQWCLKVLASIAEDHPLKAQPRPQLRLVVGGAA